MSENKISKILKYLGGFFIGISVILLLISLFSNRTYLTIAVSGVISGIVFLGFGEIIDLLQQNVEEQRQIKAKLDVLPRIVKDIIKVDSENEKDKK